MPSATGRDTDLGRHLHDKMVKAVAEDLVSRGFDVRAAHIDWAHGQPQAINGRVPDVQAWYSHNDAQYIIEVETWASSDSQHTKEQLTAFSKMPDAKTFVVVPSFCANEMRRIVREWGLSPAVRVAEYHEATGQIDWTFKL